MVNSTVIGFEGTDSDSNQHAYADEVVLNNDSPANNIDNDINSRQHNAGVNEAILSPDTLNEEIFQPEAMEGKSTEEIEDMFDEAVIEPGEIHEDEFDPFKHYAQKGIPNYMDFKHNMSMLIVQGDTTNTENDFYLEGSENNPLLKLSQDVMFKPFADFEIVSGVMEDNTSTLGLARHRPLHANNQGKGFSNNMNNPIHTTAGMSSLNNIIVATGCPASCSFCKESHNARNYSEMHLTETANLMSVIATVPGTDGEEREFYVQSNYKVKAWDERVKNVIIAPIKVALAHNLPIEFNDLIAYENREKLDILS